MTLPSAFFSGLIDVRTAPSPRHREVTSTGAGCRPIPMDGFAAGGARLGAAGRPGQPCGLRHPCAGSHFWDGQHSVYAQYHPSDAAACRCMTGAWRMTRTFLPASPRTKICSELGSQRVTGCWPRAGEPRVEQIRPSQSTVAQSCDGPLSVHRFWRAGTQTPAGGVGMRISLPSGPTMRASAVASCRPQ